MADKPKRAGRPTLHDYATAEVIRRATAAELAASRGAAFRDGGAGVITITANQAALELEQLQASRRAAKEASAAQDVTRAAMDAAELAWQKDPAAWADYHKARAAHDAAWRRSNELAMRLPIVYVLDGAGGYRHLTEAEAAHQHWLDEFTRTAAANVTPAPEDPAG